jgi:predicted nucleic acid-binding protein
MNLVDTSVWIEFFNNVESVAGTMRRLLEDG